MDAHKNFLDDDVVLTIRPQFAALLGLNESIVIQQLHYWLKKAERGQCGRSVDGHYWVWNTTPEWLEQFPFFSESTLKRIFSKLKSRGIVIIEQFDGSNRTNFYRIDYAKLDEFLENAQNSYEVKMTSCGKTPSGQSDPLEEVRLTPSLGQSDPMYITETSSETFSETSSSSIPPDVVEEDEEVVISAEVIPLDPCSLLPEEGVGGLDRAAIAEGIEQLVAAHAGDVVRYREALIREILSGGGRTIANIRRQLSPRPGARRIGSNRGELILPPGMNIFDVLENMYQDDEGGAA